MGERSAATNMTDLTPEGVTLRVQTLDVVMLEPTDVPIETEPMWSLVEQVLDVLRVGRKLKRRLETLRQHWVKLDLLSITVGTNWTP